MKTKGLDPTDIFKVIYRTSLVFGNYIYHARKGFVCSERPTKVLIFMTFTLALLWSMQYTHLKWLHGYFPEFFSQSLVHSLLLIHWFWHFLVLSTLFSLPMIYLLAVGRIRKMKACTQAFRRAGLKNALGVSPKAIDVTYLGLFRQKIKVNTEGIPVQEFEKKRNFLRSCLNTQVESIVERRQPQYIDLTITSLCLPEKVLYENACGRAINSGEFILGNTPCQLVSFLMGRFAPTLMGRFKPSLGVWESLIFSDKCYSIYWKIHRISKFMLLILRKVLP